jgi:RNA-directed DNA polymerase
MRYGYDEWAFRSRRSARKQLILGTDDVSSIEKLRAAATLDDLAQILGYAPSMLAFVLYKVPVEQRYTAFEIPKRDGTARQIMAPEPKRRLLQKRLADLLYDCIDDIKKETPHRRSLAHGFERGRSIVSNATLHKRRRFVLNLDLADFFPTINFGRVRGFFLKDRHFSLQEKVATIVAQIACHDNQLPQGSPCSPVISNLIGHLLDSRLARLAKVLKCTYSRYVDDLTFSTSKRDFPAELAFPVAGSNQWELGADLRDKIEYSGFRINDTKTRMQIRGSRQITTGLTVNDKVNIRAEYYMVARAMCHSLFTSGSYYRKPPARKAGIAGPDPEIEPVETLHHLEGVLQHIYRVRNHSDRRTPAEKKGEKTSTATRKLYHRFLFYKHFVAPDRPLIVPKGKTDNIYLKCAIERLPAFQPRLGGVKDGKFIHKLRFMKYSDKATAPVWDVLQLGGGTGDFLFFVRSYDKIVRTYKRAPCAFPVIVLVDNDSGAEDLFATIKKNYNVTISRSTTNSFYHLCHNLYLIKTPELPKGAPGCIEDLFDQSLRDTPMGGKSFDPARKRGDPRTFSKQVFAEKVIKPQAASINFDRFEMLLTRVVAVLDDYSKKTS